MTAVTEVSHLEVQAAAQDLHYQVIDPSQGTIIADVSPVAVGTSQRRSAVKQVLAMLGRGRRIIPAEAHHIGGVVLRVADRQGPTLFFFDRAEKWMVNPCVPQVVVVDASGGVLGYLTDDHYAVMTPMDRKVANNIATIRSRRTLCDRNRDVVAEIYVQSPTYPGGKPVGTPEYNTRFVGPDGVVWAEIKSARQVVEFSPQTPSEVRSLIAANMIANEVDKRLIPTGSDFRAPVPLEPSSDPYPGYQQIHVEYMEYQQKFIKWYRERATPAG